MHRIVLYWWRKDKDKIDDMILASILFHDIRDIVRGGKASVRVDTGVTGESWSLPPPQVTSVMSHTSIPANID